MEFNTEEIDKLHVLKEEYMRQCKSQGKKIIQSALASFLKAHPEVVSVGWNQWVPGFNDGDPCTFTLGEPFVKFGDVATAEKHIDPKQLKIYKEDASMGSGKVFSQEEYESIIMETGGERENGCYYMYDLCDRDDKHSLRKDLIALERMLNKAQDILEMSFGADQTITATQDGKITTGWYDCGY